MNNRYRFYFDDDDVFTCNHIVNSEDNITTGDEAIELLQEVMNIKFKKTNIMPNKLMLANDECRVTLVELDKFIKYDLLQYANRYINVIKKQIAKYQREKVKTLNCNNPKPTTKSHFKGAIAGAIVLACIGGIALSGHAFTKDPVAVEEMIDNDDEQNLASSQPVINGVVGNTIDTETISNDLAELRGMLLELQKQEEMEKQALEETASAQSIMEEEAIEESTPVIDSLNIPELDNWDISKRDYVVDNFEEIINKYAEKWGLATELVMAMMTQESGGSLENLMQIEFNAWKSDSIPIKAWNYKDNREETIYIVDKAPANREEGAMYITKEDLKNPETNISVGCLLLRQSLKYMNYHIGAGLQCYNYGIGNMKHLLKRTAKSEGVEDYKDLLKDQENFAFVNYTDIIKGGDPHYVTNCLKFLVEPDTELWVKYFDENGQEQKAAITIKRSKAYTP